MSLLNRIQIFTKIRELKRLLSLAYFRLGGVSIGKSSALAFSVKFGRPSNTSIGDFTKIGGRSVLCCLSSSARITIGSNCLLTYAVQIYSMGEVVVEDHVMIAGNVFIADSTHSHVAGDVPYSMQGFTDPLPVTIHEGAWVGQNSVIMPGCSVGRCSIVGANSVVTASVPDYSVAIGSPAKIVKVYSTTARKWIKCKH
jgi:acetyltransferase-like isoleucine patch superfamily enzyme